VALSPQDTCFLLYFLPSLVALLLLNFCFVVVACDDDPRVAVVCVTLCFNCLCVCRKSWKCEHHFSTNSNPKHFWACEGGWLRAVR
jgi:hypothetical protein